MKSSRPTVPKKNDLDSDAIEEVAGQILAYLAEDSDRLTRFFALTGFEPQSLRQAAAQPGFAASVIDYLASDEPLLLAFAKARDLNPAFLSAVRARLEVFTADTET